MIDDKALLDQLARVAETLGEFRAELAESHTRVEATTAEILTAVHTVQQTQLEFGQRIVALEEWRKRAESEPPNHPPSVAGIDTVRAPMPSLTSEERRAQTESIRAAVSEQTPLLERMARSSRWTPYAIAVGMGLAAFVSGLAQSCSWSAHANPVRLESPAPAVVPPDATAPR